MATNFEKVIEFHKFYDLPIGNYPTLFDMSQDRIDLRVALIKEEWRETQKALSEFDTIEVIDGLGDLLYVIYGFLVEMDVDADAIFQEIHRSNLTKLGQDGKPMRSPEGKILKGPKFEKPDLRKVIDNQRSINHG